MIKRKKKVKDDYGWTILSKDAEDAAESLEKILGIPNLLDSIVRAMDQDEFARFLDNVIELYDLKDDISNLNEDGRVNWKTAYETMEEIIENIGVEEVYNELINWLDYVTLSDILAYICRMHEIKIPELVKDDDEKEDDFVVEGVYREIKDGLWIESDNNATSAGHLTADPAVRYKEYVIVKRQDGMYDVYTRGSYDLVGTEFKSVEEARKNIDEGRTEKHEKTLPEEFDEEDFDEEEFDEENIEKYADPGKKYVTLEGYRFDRNADNTWKITRTPVGGRPGEQYTMKTALPSFDAAVKYWMKNISTAIDKDRVLKVMEKLDKYRVTDDRTKMRDKKNPRICDYCLKDLESREGRKFVKKIDVDEMNEKESTCDCCKESGFDTLNEVALSSVKDAKFGEDDGRIEPKSVDVTKKLGIEIPEWYRVLKWTLGSEDWYGIIDDDGQTLLKTQNLNKIKNWFDEV